MLTRAESYNEIREAFRWQIPARFNMATAIALAGVAGVPDAMRTEIIKVCLVLHEGVAADAALEHDIQDFVRRRLATHEYPRLIEFRDSLPMTTTGKIMRRMLRTPATDI